MKTKIKSLLFISFFTVATSFLNSQSLLSKLDSEFPDKPVYEIATFKTTRIGLGHSIEVRKKGALEISLYNRYWNIPDFKGQRFLADVVSTRYGLDYAFSDNFTLGLGYTNHDKIFDGFIKYRLFKQKRGSKKQTYPNFWDVSVAGHISSGETIHQGAIREIKEEIGLTILHNDLEFITIRKNVNKFSSGIIDCEFQHVFLAKLNTKIDNLIIQKEEIDDIRLFSFNEIIECQKYNNSNYKIVPADMTYYSYIIDIISKKINLKVPKINIFNKFN